MPSRLRAPSPADANAVLDVIHARDVCASAGMRTIWETERWEKPLGST